MKFEETQPKHVLITRLSAIGDCILTLPLAVSVKQLWPQCKVTWAVQCSAASLLSEHGAVDQVLKIDKKWLRSVSGLLQLRNMVRRQQFDLVLDPQGLTKSAMVGWLSGCPRRIGFDRSQAREISPWMYSLRVRRRSAHMADVYRELLSPFQECGPGKAEFEMPIYRDAAVIAERICNESRLVAPWASINVGAGWPSKMWPVQHYSKLARELFQRTGLSSLVLWAGESEREIATEIVSENRNCCVLAPPTNLQVLAELLRCSTMYVGADTGPMHLAAAVRTPCVALFGPTRAEECGPYGSGHIAIQSPLVPPRKSSMRNTDNSSMRAISVDDVAEACMKILERAASKWVA